LRAASHRSADPGGYGASTTPVGWSWITSSRTPDIAWPMIREIFYDHFGKAKPNRAHLALARLEAEGRLKVLVTQNIDNLHNIAVAGREQ
jgi:NAD-dependent SIR2 family protein deacetylase